jgi:hypothetical protein
VLFVRPHELMVRSALPIVNAREVLITTITLMAEVAWGMWWDSGYQQVGFRDNSCRVVCAAVSQGV